MRNYKIKANVHVGFKPENPPESTISLLFSQGAEDAAKAYVKRYLQGYSVISCRYSAPGLYRCEAIADAMDYGATVWVQEV